mmetsp:Transcript_28099/g.84213  ORF Transcript_28099/g.84213 Transcript_28099/m.84213 type:complete len:340 (-) Transcript_28099:51-1070(-)
MPRPWWPLVVALAAAAPRRKHNVISFKRGSIAHDPARPLHKTLPVTAEMLSAPRCWLTVQGLHHSGSGLARLVLARGLNASTQHFSKFVEHEAMFAQKVYPIFSRRNATSCPPGEPADLYTCPALVALATAENRNALVASWLAVHENPGAPILIQKQPTLDVLFLEAMFPTSGAHVLVMRHPFHWHAHAGTGAAALLEVWAAVWRRTLGDVGRLRRYVIVQTEILERVDLASFARRHLCDGVETRRRRLALHGATLRPELVAANSSAYDAVWASAHHLAAWEDFLRDSFGYSVLDRARADANVRPAFLATHLAPLPALTWPTRGDAPKRKAKKRRKWGW